ncbi:propionyl-coenzyme A carboxylase alpha polypeptide [Mesorhizobium sp. M2A.F.Ca.ET.042.01.1.1]|nr:propionyl-coenzyme A carboxylase alpha polypeptide [Mesorhizobium sp. M2A.F.Ca.ET.042.01.1.1]
MPGISPSRGEIRCHAGFRQSPALQEKRRRRNCRSPPLRGEMSGRTERGASYQRPRNRERLKSHSAP